MFPLLSKMYLQNKKISIYLHILKRKVPLLYEQMKANQKLSFALKKKSQCNHV